jgi:hypothetical protein
MLPISTWVRHFFRSSKPLIDEAPVKRDSVLKGFVLKSDKNRNSGRVACGQWAVRGPQGLTALHAIAMIEMRGGAVW